MIYTALSLNGAWDMLYDREPCRAAENPWNDQLRAGGRWAGAYTMQNAVPGYWEDMTNEFCLAPFYPRLQINPEYGIQKYPMRASIPDMALPNIVGTFYYRRTIVVEDASLPTELWFSGVQNTASVWLNDVFLGKQEGYSAPFAFTVPEGVLCAGENTIVMAVSNHPLYGLDDAMISGVTNRACNQYTGGVTGDVELRQYATPLRGAYVTFSTDCATAQVHVSAVAPVSFTWHVLDEGQPLFEGAADGSFSFATDGLDRWSPDSPRLYDLELRADGGVLRLPFGVRRLTADDDHICLNGVPCYLRGVCDHFYMAESVHPNHDKRDYNSIVRHYKELGFNFIRFHTYVPAEEYMQAADELGILMQVECPNNSTLAQWKQIIDMCRVHPSVVIYCGGNELHLDDALLAHLEQYAHVVHQETDALFSPMSALRGLEYCWEPSNFGDCIVNKPFAHNPKRLAYTETFSDVYNSYALGQNSYNSLTADPEAIDSWHSVFRKPRLSHEICIQGTYTDLSLKDRYRSSRIGDTAMFSSIEEHLRQKGVLHNAPLYFRNSSQWQRRLRKFCFESVRLCRHLNGYDFLGPIDTHWHTFGYDVGMMNEFYELKPGETVRNVLMYNSDTVLLTNLGSRFNFFAGQPLDLKLLVSHFGAAPMDNVSLNVRLTMNNRLIASRRLTINRIDNGCITPLTDFAEKLPDVKIPAQMKLYATLDGGDVYAENEWELYLFPAGDAPAGKLLIAEGMSEEELTDALSQGKDVLLFGAGPFVSQPTSFQQALAGRASGLCATVINDHPALKYLPHDGFCSWQFRSLLEGGQGVVFGDDSVPFDPIIELVTPHKYVVRQSALFEFNVLGGRLLVCSLHFDETDPAACWLKRRLIEYAQSEDFAPRHELTPEHLHSLTSTKVVQAAANANRAFNANDKSAMRKKR